MYKSPLVLGIDALELEKKDFQLERKLSFVGNNTGNIIFSEALYRNVAGSVRSSYHFVNERVEGRDAIIVAAANWLNPHSDFGALADRLDAIPLPIHVVGIGAQSTEIEHVPVLQPGTEKLIRIFADRSTSISVRGEYSAEVLNAYGIKNVEVTGCPSMLLMGSAANVRWNSDFSPQRITVQGTRHLFNRANAKQLKLYRLAFERKYDILFQSELADLYFVFPDLKDDDAIPRAREVVSAVFSEADSGTVEDYISRCGKAFFDFDEWISYAATRDLLLGSRIHGSVASLLAGTPSLLITHDTRTRELAKAMNIPYLDIDELDDDLLHDTDALNALADPGRLISGYDQYRAKFEEFFLSNRIALV